MSSVGRRLGGFAIVLVASFATAYAVGEAWPGEPAPEPPAHDGTHDTGPHDMGGSEETQP